MKIQEFVCHVKSMEPHNLNTLYYSKYCCRILHLTKHTWASVITNFKQNIPTPFKNSTKYLLQDDPNQSLLIQMAITLKMGISDPMLVKPKCVLEASNFFHFSAVCLQFSKINGGLQNTFWLYQHGVGKTYFQSYSHLN